MFALTLALLLTSGAPAPSSTARTRVLVLDLQAQGVDADTSKTIADKVAAAVAVDQQLDVISGADLRAIVDVESSKQSLGCDATAQACLAELAGALSADLVVSGSVGKLGTLVVVNLGLYDAKNQQSVGKQSFSAARIEDLVPLTDRAVDALFSRQSAGGGLSLMLAGGATLGLGVIGLALTSLGARDSFAVQDAAGSSGAAKESAESAWPLYVGGVIASSVVVAAGAGLLVVGLTQGGS